MKLTTIAQQVLGQQNESLNEGTDIGSWNQAGVKGNTNALVTTFVGPKEVESFGLGRKCMQINIGLDYVQLNPADIMELKELLKDYKNESLVTEAKNSFNFKGRIEDLDSQIGSDYYIETTDDKDTYDVIDASTKKWVGNFHYDGRMVTLLDMPNDIFQSMVNEATINQVNLSSEEYQKMKKLKAFKQHEWKWNSDTQLWTKK